jgi:hypothetical protein
LERSRRAPVVESMRNPRKIGVLTFHKCINFGSYWQARCLVEGLRRLGHNAVLLDHESPDVSRAELRCAYQPSLPQRTPRALMPQYTAKVRQFLDAFDRLPSSDRFPIDQPERAGLFDAVVVGSDEVWNFCHPWYADRPIFFGQGLRTDRLVSYAASFGNHDADRGIRADRAEQLGMFDALSVRDANSQNLLKPAVRRDVELVLDPCLQFADRIEERPRTTSEPYAVVYGHGFPEWLHHAARRWSRRAGVPLVSIGYDNRWADEQRIDVGPAEFASLMAGARAVITDFFHGCVFSLVDDKPFVAVPTDYRSNKIRDLVDLLGVQERLVSEAEKADVDNLLETPPGEATRQRIREKREQSQAFIDAALS